jgi:Mg-chelatase subunit ChlD
MSFVHPWAIVVGLGATVLPVLIHWLTRPRPRRMPLSTLRFVREVVQQRRARNRLRDLLVLTLRTAALLCLAAAVARPQFGPQPLVSDRLGGDAVRVVLVDCSQSMAATEQGIQSMERARTAAARLLRYRPGLAANLIVAGATPRAVFDRPSTNFEALGEELARLAPRPERLDVARALGLAARMLSPLSPDDRRRRELVVVSDFQRTNWQRADFALLPSETHIQLEATARRQEPVNLAIASAECRADRPGATQAQLNVVVVNSSRSPQKIRVEVTLGRGVHSLAAVCPPGQPTTLTQTMEIGEPGWQTGQARLVGIDDDLPADNVRPLVMLVRPRPIFALITRQMTRERPSSSHYLECALVPDGRAGAAASGQVVRVGPDALDPTALAAAQMLVLDHPGRLSAEAINLLAGMMRRGRPMLYVAAELIDAVNLKRLAQATGGVAMPVEFAPPPGGEFRRDLFLTTVRAQEPPFQVFGDRLETAISGLRFSGGLSSRRLADTLDDDLLATYNDGSACLVLTAADAGSLAVLNADLALSNLAKMAAFVPLMDGLVRRMLGQRTTGPTFSCGEPLVVALPTEAGPATGLTVEGPSESGSPRGELLEDGGSLLWRWASPSRPGVYRVRRGVQTVHAVAISIPDEESRLEPLAPEVLQQRLAAGREVYYRAEQELAERRDETWTWLLAACVVCLLGEVAVLLAFRS